MKLFQKLLWSCGVYIWFQYSATRSHVNPLPFQIPCLANSALLKAHSPSHQSPSSLPLGGDATVSCAASFYAITPFSLAAFKGVCRCQIALHTSIPMSLRKMMT